jgi:capsular polysaccharide biosynthesis protein
MMDGRNGRRRADEDTVETIRLGRRGDRHVALWSFEVPSGRSTTRRTMSGEEPNESIRMAVIGRILLRRWRLLAALALVGALLGLGASFLLPIQYGAAATVLLREADGNADLAAEEAHIVGSLVVLDRAAAALGLPGGGAALRGSVSAVPGDADVLEIRAAGPSPEEARDRAAAVTEQYMGFSGELAAGGGGETATSLDRLRFSLQARIADLDARIGGIESTVGTRSGGPGGELEGLQFERAEAVRGVDAIDRALQNAAMVGSVSVSLIEPAVLSSSPLPPRTWHLILGGAATAVLLGALGVVVASQRDGRLRTSSAIAAAVGAPVLCALPEHPGDVAAAAYRRQLRRRWDGRVRWWLRADHRWDAPVGSAAQLQRAANERYRRLLSRLQSSSPARPLHLLLVVPSGDLAAQYAAARLAVVAATGGAQTSVLTDSPDVAEAVESVLDHEPPDLPVTISSDADEVSATTQVVLHVTDASPTRPVVVTRGPVAATLMIVGAGTCTGWELVNLAQACDDAGYAVTGVILSGTSVRRDDEQQPGSDAVLTRNAVALVSVGER